MILDYKFPGRVLALAKDVVMDAVLHGGKYDKCKGANDIKEKGGIIIMIIVLIINYDCNNNNKIIIIIIC